MPIHKTFNRDLFKTWSPEMAYALGFIFADGSVFQNRRRGYYLELTSTDLELIKKLRKILKSNHKIGVKKSKHPNWNTSYRIQIGSKQLLADLAGFGVYQNKSLTVKFPKIPKSYMGHFIRGYFDGDGGVNLGYYWKKDRNSWRWQFTTQFTSGSKDFLNGLIQVLNKSIIGGNLHKKYNRNGFDFTIGKHDSIALFKLMYNNAPTSMFLARKYRLFQKAFRVLNYSIAGVV